MFFMPWVRSIVARQKPTAQNPCRGYQHRQAAPAEFCEKRNLRVRDLRTTTIIPYPTAEKTLQPVILSVAKNPSISLFFRQAKKMPRCFAQFTLSGQSEILRFAQDDKRRAQHDILSTFSFSALFHSQLFFSSLLGSRSHQSPLRTRRPAAAQFTPPSEGAPSIRGWPRAGTPALRAGGVLAR